MMRHFRLLVPGSTAAGLLLVTAMIMAACDRGDADSVQATHCASYCAALEKCDDGTDLADCEDHCKADEVHSDAYFKAQANCGEELSCNLWVTEVDNQGAPNCQGDCDLKECVDRALAKVEPTQEQEQTCSSIGSKLNACDPGLASRSTAHGCTRATSLLSPAYVQDSELCLERDCDEINSCLDELADEYGTELRLFSGMLVPR